MNNTEQKAHRFYAISFSFVFKSNLLWKEFLQLSLRCICAIIYFC